MFKTAKILTAMALVTAGGSACAGAEFVSYDELAADCISAGFNDTDLEQAAEQRTEPSALVAMIAVKASDCLRRNKDWSCSTTEPVCTDPGGAEHDLVADVVNAVQGAQ